MKDPEKQPQSEDADSSTLDKPHFPVTDLSRGIVGWDGQDDPANPQNFSSTKKWSLLALISSVTLISPLASSMFSPAVGYMGKDFGESNEVLLSFSVSIFLLGYTVILPWDVEWMSMLIRWYSLVRYCSPPSVKSTVVALFSAPPTGSSLFGKSDAPWPRISLL